MEIEEFESFSITRIRKQLFLICFWPFKVFSSKISFKKFNDQIKMNKKRKIERKEKNTFLDNDTPHILDCFDHCILKFIFAHRNKTKCLTTIDHKRQFFLNIFFSFDTVRATGLFHSHSLLRVTIYKAIKILCV